MMSRDHSDMLIKSNQYAKFCVRETFLLLSMLKTVVPFHNFVETVIHCFGIP